MERTDFEQFLLWNGVVFLWKDLILNSFYIVEGCGGIVKRNDFEQFLHREGVVVLKEVIVTLAIFGMV